jgi:hypothetical protein
MIGIIVRDTVTIICDVDKLITLNVTINLLEGRKATNLYNILKQKSLSNACHLSSLKFL